MDADTARTRTCGGHLSPGACLPALRAAGWLVLLAAAATGAHASEGAAEAAAQGPLEVFASIPPQAGILEAIGGEHVRVHVLVQPGQEPHTYEPTPRQIAALGTARLYFRIGLPFEGALLARIGSSRPDSTIVDMGAGVPRRFLAGGADAPDTRAAPQGHDHAGEADPHIWLSPISLPLLARNAARSLAAIDPLHAETYARNLAAYEGRVAAVHQRLAELLAPCRGRAFYVFHPAFGYFADAYGLEQVAVEREGKPPSPRQLAELIGRARGEGVKVVFVQPQFDPRSASSVAAGIGGKVVALDALAEDAVASIELIGLRIAEACRE